MALCLCFSESGGEASNVTLEKDDIDGNTGRLEMMG